MLRIGLFQEFKGIDAVVLVDADEKGIEVLLDSVATVSSDASTSIAVHEVSLVSRTHPVELYLSQGPMRSDAVAYHLVVGGDVTPAVSEKLSSLRHCSGHHYFELRPNVATLLISVGEYGPVWWEKADA
jgi:hypothetical protein